jgi:hypothetical protein
MPGRRRTNCNLTVIRPGVPVVTDHSLYRESAGKWTQIATGYVAPTAKA